MRKQGIENIDEIVRVMEADPEEKNLKANFLNRIVTAKTEYKKGLELHQKKKYASANFSND